MVNEPDRSNDNQDETNDNIAPFGKGLNFPWQLSPEDINALLKGALTLNIPEELAQGLISHARGLSPENCWGIITGQGLQAEAFHPLQLNGNTFYCWGIELEGLRQAQEPYQRPEQQVLAFYHSHNGMAGCPVILDTPSMANWPLTLRHVVISLGEAIAPTLQVYRRRGKRFTEETSSSIFSLGLQLRGGRPHKLMPPQLPSGASEPG